ncbi:hypothetical protein PHJA_000344200 [Phtheirospermum japonicum]|uniref:Uncharacterized protein n=1 Tax=Phtheirospermum japonicum TaxID=374723 RepID=A0A830B9T3_9LAMI|nr:hypothetical protein PHJA_000344200 [Phtheirospermum japonicum]
MTTITITTTTTTTTTTDMMRRSRKRNAAVVKRGRQHMRVQCVGALANIPIQARAQLYGGGE